MNSNSSIRGSGRDETSRASVGGFSLIELLVVITIIGILATVVVSSVSDEPDKAKVVRVKQDFATLNQAVNIFKITHGVFPESIDELRDGPADPTTDEPTSYIENDPIDPFSNETYLMEFDDRGKPYFISLGQDKAEGGEGVARDLFSNDRAN